MAKSKPAKKAPKRTLGGMVKKLTKVLGFEPCDGCDERSKTLDRVGDKLRR